MTGVILLAGKGRRLGKDLPKCLNVIAGETILERQLNALSKFGVEKLVCAVGYKKEEIERSVRSLWSKEVLFVENERYEETNTNYSLYLAIDHVEDDFVYLNGDVIFRADILARLDKCSGDGVLGIVRKTCGDEEVKVIVQGNKIVEIGKNLSPTKSFGEFVGVALFRKNMFNLFSKTLRESNEERGLENEYFETSLAQVTDRVFLEAADVTDIPCIEIDFPEDLMWAKEHGSEFDQTGE